MNSRERILAAIAHKTPDRIPVDLRATPSSGISAIAYSNLVKHLGRPELPVQVYDVVQQLAQPDMSLLDQFGVDVLDIGRTFNNRSCRLETNHSCKRCSGLLSEMVQSCKIE